MKRNLATANIALHLVLTKKSELKLNDKDVFLKPAQTYSDKPRIFILCENKPA